MGTDPRDEVIAYHEQNGCSWDEAAAACGGKCTGGAARSRFHRLRKPVQPSVQPGEQGAQKEDKATKLGMYRWMVRRVRRDIRILRAKKPEAMAAMYRVLMDAHDRLLLAEAEVGGVVAVDATATEELEQVVNAADSILRLARE